MPLDALRRWLAPGRFEKAGRGIERRARRLRKYWEPHLARTRRAQAEWAVTLPAGGDLLSILGAGRLLDVDAEALSTRFRRIRLVDADPTCEPRWRKLRAKLAGTAEVDWEVRDLTGCLDPWSRKYDEAVRDATWEESLRLLAAHAAPPPVDLAAGGAVLSLNLLSQIPIFWQDSVEELLGRKFGNRFVKEREQQWLGALQPGARALVDQHLAGLAASGASAVLLVTDLEYLEYTESADTGPFHTSDALYGADPSILPGYDSGEADRWLWQISPLGLEDAPHGTIHRVGAFRYTKSR